MLINRVYIEIHNQCNLSCTFCPPTKRNRNALTIEQFKYILNEIKAYTQHIYLHVQGEPLLHPNLLQFLDLAAVNNLKVHLVTNGTLIHLYEGQLLTHPAIVQLTLSMHAWETLDEHSFERLTQSLAGLIKQSEISQASFFIRIWNQKSQRMASILNRFFDPSLIEQWKQSGKHRIKISPKITLDLDEEFRWPNLEDPWVGTQGTCHAGTKMMAILSNGEVTPCCLDPQGILSYGNIFKTSFKDLLLSQRHVDLVQGFKQNHCHEPLCQHCTYRLRFTSKKS